GEEPLQAEYFIVTPARIERGLLDDVRYLVRRDAHTVQESAAARDIGEIDDDAVDQAAAGERAARSGRRDGRAGADDLGRIFDRYAEGYSGGDFLHRADLPLPDIVEPDHIVRVDRERDVLLARRDPDLVLGGEAPRLAGEKMKSPTAVVITDKALP